MSAMSPTCHLDEHERTAIQFFWFKNQFCSISLLFLAFGMVFAPLFAAGLVVGVALCTTLSMSLCALFLPFGGVFIAAFCALFFPLLAARFAFIGIATAVTFFCHGTFCRICRGGGWRRGFQLGWCPWLGWGYFVHLRSSKTTARQTQSSYGTWVFILKRGGKDAPIGEAGIP